MIPLRDTVPARTRPFVTHGIIVLNVLVFLVQLAHRYGLLPGTERLVVVR